MLAEPLKIANLTLPNRIFLAPMSGVSDKPFRDRAVKAGAGLVVCEMAASAQLCQTSVKTLKRTEADAGAHYVVQLAGHEAIWLSKAAQLVEAAGAHMVDINMGCPAKKVTGKLCGAALMRDVSAAAMLIEQVVKSVKIPVTVKMRLGWDDAEITAPLLAKYAQEAGAAMITVHGRTRQQFYTGKANHHLIKAVKQAISIPLVANGDIGSYKDALNSLDASGADAVMIGRATYGQPWLCGEILGYDKPKDIANYVISHYEDMLSYYGNNTGIRHARKHLDWYLQKHRAGQYDAEFRSRLLRNTSVSETISLLSTIFS